MTEIAPTPLHGEPLCAAQLYTPSCTLHGQYLACTSYQTPQYVGLYMSILPVAHPANYATASPIKREEAEISSTICSAEEAAYWTEQDTCPSPCEWQQREDASLGPTYWATASGSTEIISFVMARSDASCSGFSQSHGAALARAGSEHSVGMILARIVNSRSPTASAVFTVCDGCRQYDDWSAVRQQTYDRVRAFQ